jgi:hypothetical protein
VAHAFAFHPLVSFILTLPLFQPDPYSPSRNSGWRDLGLLLSMSTSLYLIASRRDVAWANYFNVFFHLVFLLARDFFIKALFSFRGLKFG